MNSPLKSNFRFYMLVVMLFFLVSCGQKEKPPEEPPSNLVKTFIIGENGKIIKRSYPGTVVASDKVDLAFQVSGPLIQLPIEEGQEIKKGQLLAHIDPRDFKNRLKAEKAELHKSTLNFNRARKLLSSGTISVATYDETKAAYDIAAARVATAQKALEDTYLRAPFDGVVAKKYVENFENVRAKQKILSFQDIVDLDIVINLPEQDLVRLPKKGNRQNEIPYRHSVVFGALPGIEYQAKLKEYATEADPITQTYRITLTMPAPKDFNILPGMTATFNITGEIKNHHVYYIPVNAVAIDEKGQHYVWLVNSEKMTVHRKDIQVGDMLGGSIRVKSGLTRGDKIVSAGTAYLHEGEKIRFYRPKSREYKL